MEHTLMAVALALHSHKDECSSLLNGLRSTITLLLLLLDELLKWNDFKTVERLPTTQLEPVYREKWQAISAMLLLGDKLPLPLRLSLPMHSMKANSVCSEQQERDLIWVHRRMASNLHGHCHSPSMLTNSVISKPASLQKAVICRQYDRCWMKGTQA